MTRARYLTLPKNIFDKCPTLTDAKALEIKFRASGHLIHTELLGIACL